MGLIADTERQITGGHRLSYDEALRLVGVSPVGELCGLAGRLRRHFHGDRVDTCSIMNARSGRCGEDCKWCSQSRFHNSDIDVYPLVGAAEAVAAAKHNAAKGVGRFSLVTSGRAVTGAEMDMVCEMYRGISRVTDIGLCASMGLLDGERLGKLYDAGVSRYHCNLETAPSFFPQLCTTHTVEEKIRTLHAARGAGMDICSGGIIGMGETREHRVELAVTLAGLGVKSIPVNILNPIPGTRLEAAAPLPDDEVLRSVAMFRIVNPDAHIRLAGGRALVKHLERRLMHAGVSALIVGDMLTTSGSDIDSDKEMFKKEGFWF